MNRPTAFTQIASKKKIVSLLTVPWVFLGHHANAILASLP